MKFYCSQILYSFSYVFIVAEAEDCAPECDVDDNVQGENENSSKIVVLKSDFQRVKKKINLLKAKARQEKKGFTGHQVLLKKPSSYDLHVVHQDIMSF